MDYNKNSTINKNNNNNEGRVIGQNNTTKIMDIDDYTINGHKNNKLLLMTIQIVITIKMI